ncbi:amidohydrolase family protein [Williamsia sp. CHRR-6]|nr:amidohydrolase family protein [Williamsia sp. CHRR-6]
MTRRFDHILRGRLVSASVCVDDGIVAVANGSIAWVGPVDQWPETTPPQALPSDQAIVPGLIDVHCHGGGGWGFPESDGPGCAAAADFHRRAGSTSVLASLVSAPVADIDRQIRELAELAESGVISGIHLEGPFLAVARCGAQDPRHIIDGDPAILDRLLSAGRGTVAAVTLAPETARFGELVDVARDHGVMVGLGHSDASYSVAAESIARSAERPLLATHLFNGMAPLHHREPGLAGACLAAAGRGELVAELIADGVHLADGTVAMIFDLLGPHRITLISDAMVATGMADGRYRLGPQDVDVVEGVARLYADDEQVGSLAGSTSTLADVLARTVTHAGVPLQAAVVAATHTPARLLGVDAGVGDLRAGMRADLLVLDGVDPSAAAPMSVRAVMNHGSWVD